MIIKKRLVAVAAGVTFFGGLTLGQVAVSAAPVPAIKVAAAAYPAVPPKLVAPTETCIYTMTQPYVNGPDQLVTTCAIYKPGSGGVEFKISNDAPYGGASPGASNNWFPEQLTNFAQLGGPPAYNYHVPINKDGNGDLFVPLSTGLWAGNLDAPDLAGNIVIGDQNATPFEFVIGDPSAGGGPHFPAGCPEYVGDPASVDNFGVTPDANQHPTLADFQTTGIASVEIGGCPGYLEVDAMGEVWASGSAFTYGDLHSVHLSSRIIAITATPDGKGYWLLGQDGGVFAFGDARFYGSTGGMKLNAPVVGMASTADGRGYWLVASDGGIFSFGDARFHGSTGNLRLNKPIDGMAVGPGGHGYWLVASDGGVFAFNEPFIGSMGGRPLNKPIVGMSSTPNGRGYTLVASDGGVFSFGDAPFLGSLGGEPVLDWGTGGNDSIASLASTATNKGYYLLSLKGGVFAFGDAA